MIIEVAKRLKTIDQNSIGMMWVMAQEAIERGE
jgi:hypothetical protein